MKCKFCLAEIEDDVTVCPLCGKELEVSAEEEILGEEETAEKTEETKEVREKTKKDRKGLRIALAVTGLVLLAAILTGAVLHFTGVINVKKWFSKQDIFYKDTYTAANAKVEKRGNKVIAKMGNQVLTNSELQVHYWNTVSDFILYNGGQYGSYYVKYFTGMDPEAPLNTQVYDKDTGKTYEQWFLENAIESWRRQASLVQLGEDSGFEMTAEQQKALDNLPETIKQQAQTEGYSDVEAYVDQYYPGSSLDGYVQYNRLMLKAMFYYDVLYETLAPSQAELEAYYTQNEAYFKKNLISKEDGLYYDVRHIYIPIQGEPGEIQGVEVYSDEEWAQCEAKAQKVLDDFLADGGTEAIFAERAKEISADSYSAVNGGLYEKVTKHSGFVDSFMDWLKADGRKYGDTGLVKNTGSAPQGYHVMFFCKSYAIWEYEADAAVLAEKTDAVLKEAEAKYPITVRYSKIVLGQQENTEATQPSQ